TFLLALFSCMFLAISCSKKTTTYRSGQPVDIQLGVSKPSVFNINFELSYQSLSDTLAFILDDIFKEKMVFPEQTTEVTLKRSRPVKVELQNRSILVSLPLDIDVLKKTRLVNLHAT